MSNYPANEEINGTRRERVVRAFARVINCESLENGSDTPDWQLAEYLTDCLESYNKITRKREAWYGRESKPIPADQCPVLLEQLVPNAIIYRND